MDEQVLEHFCVPNSVRDAWTWEVRTKRPARIAVCKRPNGDDHSQAQGQLPDGSWVPLTTHNSDGLLRTWTPHFPEKPYRYLTLKEWIEEQLPRIKEQEGIN